MVAALVQFRGLRDALFGALALAITLQGLLVALPHNHPPQGAPLATTADHAGCSSRTDDQLLRETPNRTNSPCLACAVHSVAFARAETTPTEVLTGSPASHVVASRPMVTPSRIWRPLLRAPPTTS
jgi:hypothetical protein